MADNIDQWHSATFNAWVRNDGAHKSKAKGYYSWNSELVEPVACKMGNAWLSFDKSIEEGKEKYFSSLIQLLEAIRETLKGMSSCVNSI